MPSRQSDEGYVRPPRDTYTYVPDHARSMLGEDVSPTTSCRRILDVVLVLAALLAMFGRPIRMADR